MAILLFPDTKVLVQYVASNYARGMIGSMRAAGTTIVAGVAAGMAASHFEDVRVFDLVEDACAATGATASVCFAPPPRVHDAIVEAVSAGIKLILVVAEFVPTSDMLRAVAYARAHDCWVIGPNSAGMLIPGIGALGGYPAAIGMPGRVGIISRSGTTSMILAATLTRAGIGQSSIISIGGDAVIGRNPHEYIQLLNEDPGTDVIVMAGEIGGLKEYEVARILPTLRKPLIAYIGGRHAPPGRRFGHAGALVTDAAEDAGHKLEALQRAGAIAAATPSALLDAVRSLVAQPTQT